MVEVAVAQLVPQELPLRVQSLKLVPSPSQVLVESAIVSSEQVLEHRHDQHHLHVRDDAQKRLRDVGATEPRQLSLYAGQGGAHVLLVALTSSTMMSCPPLLRVQSFSKKSVTISRCVRRLILRLRTEIDRND